MWYHLTHKLTGDRQIVCELNGYDEADFNMVEVGEAEPTGFEDFIDGALVLNAARKADSEVGVVYGG